MLLAIRYRQATRGETSVSTDIEGTEETQSGFLNWIERVGNKVPNPSIMFLYLIGLIAGLSAVLSWMGIHVTEQVATPNPAH